MKNIITVAKFAGNAKKTVIGVVAEYDPFHNGHALHLTKARDIAGTAPVVVVLSSSFTQRGLPALTDKMARAKMALANGASLVLELPFVHACSSGQKFARGAVSILAATQLVTHIAFGAEDADAFSLTKTSELLNILIQEPLSFKTDLKKKLADGCSYPKALALALESELPGSWDMVSSPNNALAISYLTEIKKNGYPLIPIAVQREGSAHNDETPGFLPGSITSASAIRKALSGCGSAWVSGAVPPSVLDILDDEREKGRLYLSDGKLWDLFRGLLARSAPQDLENCVGMEEGLENLFLKHYARADSYEDFLGRCVCARYTRNRLRRQTIYCLAGLSASSCFSGEPPYIRVLGYDCAGRELLRERRKIDDAVPVITRLAAANDISAAARKMSELEFRASRLRELFLPKPDLTREEKLIPVQG